MAAYSNHPTSTITATTTATRPFAAAPTLAVKSPSRPQTPFPLYQFYASQNIPFRPQTQTKAQNPNPNSSAQQQQQPGILYPVASSGRGFIPRPIRPLDQAVTVANYANITPGAYHPRAVAVGHRPAIGSAAGSPSSHPHLGSRSHPSYHHHPVHMIRQHPTHFQHQQQPSVVGSYVAGCLAPIKGIPFTGHLKASSSPMPVSDSNGYKNLRDKSRDDTLIMIRDRKVRISEEASLYALCRSWLRNGFPEESQPHCRDAVQVLPEPLPLSDVDPHSKKKEDEVEENGEDEESVGHLSAQDLLRRHIKRAKKVRVRLQERRLKRIARFKTRLAMLLPPQVEQFRNETAIGN